MLVAENLNEFQRDTDIKKSIGVGKIAKGYDDPEGVLNKLFELLIPSSGNAGTIEGEIVRAFAKINYRFYNDGDVFYGGYGAEVVGPAVVFLLKSPIIPNDLRVQIKKLVQDNERSYFDYRDRSLMDSYEKNFINPLRLLIVDLMLRWHPEFTMNVKELKNLNKTDEDYLNYESNWEEEEEDICDGCGNSEDYCVCDDDYEDESY